MTSGRLSLLNRIRRADRKFTGTSLSWLEVHRVRALLELEEDKARRRRRAAARKRASST